MGPELCCSAADSHPANAYTRIPAASVISDGVNVKLSATCLQWVVSGRLHVFLVGLLLCPVFELVGRYSDEFQGSSDRLAELVDGTQAGDSQGPGEIPRETSRRQVWTVTETDSFVLCPLLGDRRRITKQSSVCFPMSVGRLERKCFQLVTKSIGRLQQLQLCWQPVPRSQCGGKRQPLSIHRPVCGTMRSYA